VLTCLLLLLLPLRRLQADKALLNLLLPRLQPRNPTEGLSSPKFRRARPSKRHKPTTEVPPL